MRAKNYVAYGIRVRLKTTDFQMLTRQMHLPRGMDTAGQFLAAARKLLRQFDHPGPFRLVGMAAFDLDWRQGAVQLDLFEDHTRRELEVTIDRLLERFRNGTLMRAKDLRSHGTVHNNGVNLDFLDYRDGERVSRPG